MFFNFILSKGSKLNNCIQFNNFNLYDDSDNDKINNDININKLNKNKRNNKKNDNDYSYSSNNSIDEFVDKLEEEIKSCLIQDSNLKSKSGKKGNICKKPKKDYLKLSAQKYSNNIKIINSANEAMDKKKNNIINSNSEIDYYTDISNEKKFQLSVSELQVNKIGNNSSNKSDNNNNKESRGRVFVSSFQI
jgi:hypothetical protein